MHRLHCTIEDGTKFDVPPTPAVASSCFQEQGRYVFHLMSATECVLVVDDVALPCMRNGDIHYWEWSPSFFAGTVVAELLDHKLNRLADYRLEVTPEAGKLGKGQFERMIDELLDADPRLLFGEEAAQMKIGTAGDYGDPHLEYARLKLYGPKLLTALREVCREPFTALSRERQLVSPHHVRRIDANSARALLRAPHTLATVRRGEQARPNEALFNVPVSREIFDTPAHRTLLRQILSVSRRVRKVRESLKELGVRKENPGFRTAMAPRLPYRARLLDQLDNDLRRICRTAPFTEVGRAEVSAAGLNVISGHPLYATAYRRAWQILKPGIAGESQEEMLSISPTWEIYERWCFLQLSQLLRGIFPDLHWQRSRSGSKFDRLLEVGTCDGIRVELHLQSTFPALDCREPGSARYSISKERRPDLVVTYKDGEISRFLVLDAKYSVSRESVLSAMEAAHIYRDCLRWDDTRAVGAVLLTPAPGGASWLEEADFLELHGVGVLPLSPDIGQLRLRKLLERSLLDDLPEQSGVSRNGTFHSSPDPSN